MDEKKFIKCPECDCEVYIYNRECSSCGWTHYPHVTIANSSIESDALDEKYQASLACISMKGGKASRNLEHFRKIIATESKAIMAIPVPLLELHLNDSMVFQTYHKRISQGSQTPNGNKWETPRSRTEGQLFKHLKDSIHFMALSLKNLGSVNYGEIHLTFKEKNIKKRTCAYISNNVIWHDEDFLGKPYEPGLICSWGNREKLCVIKHKEDLSSLDQCSIDEVQNFLLKETDDNEDQDFIELFVWEPINIRSVEEVVVLNKDINFTPARWEACEIKLKSYGIEWIDNNA